MSHGSLTVIQQERAERIPARVAVEQVVLNPDASVRRILESFPEIINKLKKCRYIFIKVNAVYFHPHLFTSPSLITAVITYIREYDPAKKIFIMDNCSQGNFTRLCFAATGIDRLARKAGVNRLYLDEEKTVRVSPGRAFGENFSFPRILNRRLIEERDDSFYLNMPVLKAHCQAQMTAGLKNQMGLLNDEDRARDHNQGLHQKIVDIYRYIRPDFTLVDALKVLARGPMPAGRYVHELLHDRDLIIGGTDTVAVDAVAASVLGYNPEEVRHLKLASEQGLGVVDLEQIKIEGRLPPVTERIPWEFKTHFPESIQFIKGKDGACYEGCLGHAEQVLELVVNDGSSPEKLSGRPLTIVTGRNFYQEQLENLQEPVMVLGKCACEETFDLIRKSYGRVDALNTCGRCDNILSIALKRLKISPTKMAPVSVPKLLFLWVVGKLHGLKYNLPL